MLASSTGAAARGAGGGGMRERSEGGAAQGEIPVVPLDAARGPERPRHLADVEKRREIGALVRLDEAALSIRPMIDDMPLFAERFGHERGHAGIVLDQQDVHRLAPDIPAAEREGPPQSNMAENKCFAHLGQRRWRYACRMQLLCAMYGHWPAPFMFGSRLKASRCCLCEQEIVHRDGKWRRTIEGPEATDGPVSSDRSHPTIPQPLG